MVLLILPVVWAAVLLPPWVRHLRERRADHSVALFNRRMSSLQRSTTVSYVFGSYDPYRDIEGVRGPIQENDISYLPDAAYEDSYEDLAAPDTSYLYEHYGHPSLAEDAGVDAEDDADFDADIDADDDDEWLDNVQPLPPPQPALTRSPVAARRSAATDARNSRAALRRRRQIFFALFLAFLASLVAVVVLQSAVAWAAHLVAVVLFVGYVNLLVRHHQRVSERSSKVHRLASPSSGAVGRPAVVVLGGAGR